MESGHTFQQKVYRVFLLVRCPDFRYIHTWGVRDSQMCPCIEVSSSQGALKMVPLYHTDSVHQVEIGNATSYIAELKGSFIPSAVCM